MKTPAPAPASRAEILRIIADMIDAGLPEPYDVTMSVYFNGGRGLRLRMEENNAAGVAAWADKLGLDVKIGKPFVGPRRAWREYCAGDHLGAAANFHGWAIDVWAAVDADPHQ